MNEVIISPIITSNHYTEGYDSLSDEEAAAYAKATRKSVRATKTKDFATQPQRPRLHPVHDPLDSDDDDLSLDERPVRTNRKDFNGNGNMNGSKPDVSLAEFLRSTTPDGFTPPPPPRRSSMMPLRQKPSKNTFDKEPMPTNNKLVSSSRSIKSVVDDDLEFGAPKLKIKSETADLAEFLKSTGPIESPESRYSSDRSSFRSTDKQNKWLSPLIGGLWKRPNSTIVSPSNSTPVSPTRPKSKYVPLIPSPSSSEFYNRSSDPRVSQSSSQLGSIDQSKPLPPSPIQVRYTNSIRSNASQYPPSPKSSLTRHPSENGSISTIGILREFESDQLEAMRQLQETSFTQIKALEQLIKQQQHQIIESRPAPLQSAVATGKRHEMFVQTDEMETYAIHTQTHSEMNDTPATLDFLNILEPTENEAVNLQTENAYLKNAIHSLQKQLVYERRANEKLAASMASNTHKFEQLSIVACEKFAELWNEKCDWEDEALELRGRVDALLDVQGIDTVGLELNVSSSLMVNDIRSKRRSYFA